MLQVGIRFYFTNGKSIDRLSVTDLYKALRVTPEEAFAVAVKILGGKAALAAAIGTTRQNVNVWKTVPAKWVLTTVEAIKKAQAVKAPTAHQLCPQMFPVKQSKPRAAGRGAASARKTAKTSK